MLPLAILAGVGSFLVVLGGALLLRCIPANRACPICDAPTAALQPGFWLRLVRPRLHRRWCAECGWTGVRRTRAPVGPGQRPPAHESGFHWGRPEASRAPLFVWRSRSPSEEPDEPPADTDHPSGFRWKEGPSEDAPVFEWRSDEEEGEAG